MLQSAASQQVLETHTPSQALSAGTQTILRGIAIMMVVIAHAIGLCHEAILPSERLLIAIMAKFTAPCVFIFIFLMGYGQGLKKRRLSFLSALRRVPSILVPFLFWATVSFVCYQILQGPYLIPYTGRLFLGDYSILSQYFLSLSTFTGSWQYYYAGLFIFFLLYSSWMRTHKYSTIESATKVFLVGHILFLSILSSLLWFVPVGGLPLDIITMLIYANPLAWIYVFYLGFVHGMKKSPVSANNTRVLVFLFFTSWAFGAFELAYLLLKWETSMVSDQFTLFGFLFSLIALILFVRVAKRWSSKLSQGYTSWWLRWLMRFGKHSLLIFLIHLPFMWFLLVALESMVQRQFSTMIRMVILVASGLFFPYAIGLSSRRLPVIFRKAMTGF